MPPETPPKITPRFILGVFILLVGIALALDRLGVVQAHHAMRFWPAVLIVFGLTVLQRGRHGAVTGLLLIIVGSWLLLNTLGIVSLQVWEFLWPLILVFVGARIIMRSGRMRARTPKQPPNFGQAPAAASPPYNPSQPYNSSPPSSPAMPANTGAAANASDHASVFSVLGSCRRRWGKATFRSAEAVCVMGGFELDLRDALMGAEGSAQIEVLVIMGGLHVLVPQNWNVVSNVVPILGGIDDKTRANTSGATQQLILRGTVLMGGVEIGN
jgi:predicted membrane protein